VSTPPSNGSSLSTEILWRVCRKGVDTTDGPGTRAVVTTDGETINGDQIRPQMGSSKRIEKRRGAGESPTQQRRSEGTPCEPRLEDIPAHGRDILHKRSQGSWNFKFIK
jgi:hypothetical protein